MEIENIRDISGIIRERKRFLKEVRRRTEITPNDNYNLYYDIMRYVCGTWHLDYNKEIAPTMRIAYNPNCYGGGCAIYHDRIVIFVDFYNVDLCISFNVEELAKYILLYGNDTRGSYVECVLYWYSEKLISNVRRICPRSYFKVSDLLYKEYTKDREIRWASILATYLHIISKRKMLARRADKRIKEFFNNK